MTSELICFKPPQLFNFGDTAFSSCSVCPPVVSNGRQRGAVLLGGWRWKVSSPLRPTLGQASLNTAWLWASPSAV